MDLNKRIDGIVFEGHGVGCCLNEIWLAVGGIGAKRENIISVMSSIPQMRSTRSKGEKMKLKFDNRDKIRGYERSKEYYDLVHQMMEKMSENNVDPQILVPINSRVQMMQEEMQSKNFILMGPGHSGKSATVHWVTQNCRQKQKIWIDCRFWKAQNAFITHLLEQVSICYKRELKKNLIMKGELSFKELNREMKKQNLQVMIIIKNPENLSDQRRPVILYNIFEWMNSNMNAENLSFVLITRQIRFIDNLDKRIKSRMNIPIIFFSRPKAEKIKEIIIKRIQSCGGNAKRVEMCNKLKKAFENKQIQKLMVKECETKVYPITYYLKIMELILAIDLESEQKWSSLSQAQLNEIVRNGFQNYSMYIVDHRNMAKTFFSASNIPEIILMGLYRIRFLRQKEGTYNCAITLGELINDYNIIKRKVNVEQGGSSFLFSQKIMQNALRNLIDWNFLTFSRVSEKSSIMNRQIDSRYGPEDIEYLYENLEGIPSMVKAIYNDSI